MAIGTGKPSFECITDKVSEFTLAAYYLGVNKLPCLINSPLRKDNKPSFGLLTNDGKTLGWTDFATRESGGNIFSLLSQMWHLNLKDTYNRILEDLPNICGNPKLTSKKFIKRMSVKSNTEMMCKVRRWLKHDIEYWKSYGISLKWLKYAEVYPISHKIIIKDGKEFIFGADKYAYAYVEHKEGRITLKIYQPFNKDGFKWSNKHDKSVISLWTKVPDIGNKICICSSLKDALCLWSNTGIPSLAIQGEGYSMSNTAISELKRRYKNIYILLDNDNAGIKDSIKLSKLTGFKNITLPKFEEGKDISDLYKAVGKEKFLDIIIPLFKN